MRGSMGPQGGDGESLSVSMWGELRPMGRREAAGGMGEVAAYMDVPMSVYASIYLCVCGHGASRLGLRLFERGKATTYRPTPSLLGPDAMYPIWPR